MEQRYRERLLAAGIDVEEALGRFMGNEALLERFLRKFPQDENYSRLREAVAAGDREGALRAAHTLKGVCGNLSMTALFSLLARQVELFRAGEWEQACALLEEIAPVYQAVAEAVCPPEGRG